MSKKTISQRISRESLDHVASSGERIAQILQTTAKTRGVHLKYITNLDAALITAPGMYPVKVTGLDMKRAADPIQYLEDVLTKLGVHARGTNALENKA